VEIELRLLLRKESVFVKVFLALLILMFGLASPASAQDDQASTITKILNTRALWGKDFPAALASLPAWDRAGEHAIAIFPAQIVGTTPFKTPEAAQPARAALSAALSQPLPEAAPPFTDLFKGLRGGPLPFQSEIVQVFDDDSFRIAIVGKDVQFLPPGLTVKQVEISIGLPQVVTTQVIQSERDRRPVILTLHSYADGAIVFAESDWQPTPGIVDRVILNVPVVSAIVLRKGQ
jgi:hypothetical protein